MAFGFQSGTALFTTGNRILPCFGHSRALSLPHSGIGGPGVCVIGKGVKMSDFAFAFLVVIALAAVGSFASSPDAFQTQCAGSWLNFCW